MDPQRPRKIVVTKNGPYLVYGGVPLAVEYIEPNEEGGSWQYRRGKTFDVKPAYALCRCGHSANKPFCDGTHAKIGFDGSETANREPYRNRAETTTGPDFALDDVEILCASARFCDNYGSAWKLVEETNDPHKRELLLHEVARCPSGRLVLRRRGTGEPVEPPYEQSIVVVEDPAQGQSGPLWVRGGIPIESAESGRYEVRNRVTLCRCGRSQNKPFCDGNHLEGFKDPFLEE